MGERIAWARLLRVAARDFGIMPDQFWLLTPAEFLLIAGHGEGGARSMTRSALDALVARFPDREPFEGRSG